MSEIDYKSANFKRLAEKRTNEILDVLDKLANLGNKNNYDYTELQASQIIHAIEGKLEVVKNAFNGKVVVKKKFELL
jgi:hypothetical protein|tara:strand:+ start:295 stop:525 length:231 start_codon:yes stop_codon:yes gene_type:complete